MVSDKKRDLIHVGARVRVADPLESGAGRWINARAGVVTDVRAQDEGRGVIVLVDGESRPDFEAWSDVDVEQRPRHTWLELPLAALVPSRWQYRRRFDADGLFELAQSIDQAGLINRLLVFSHEDGEHYELIAGERRLRACWALALARLGGANLAGAAQLVAAADWWEQAGAWHDRLAGETVPCERRQGAAADFREIVILENLQREDPSAVEEAEAFQLLLFADGYTQVSLAKKLGKSQGYISQRLGLLGLASSVRDQVADQEVSFTTARAIATLPAAVQPAIMQYVQGLALRVGDSQATTRQVQTLAGQVRRFLDPQTWMPPADEVIEPRLRNRWRLMRWQVEHPDGVDLGAGLVRLTVTNRENVLAKKAATIVRESYLTGKALDALLGAGDHGYNGAKWHWQRVAPEAGWTCESCQFSTVRAPAICSADALCERWRGYEAQTCFSYLPKGDRVVLPVPDLHGLLSERIDHLPTLDSGSPYAADLDWFVLLLEDLAVAKADADAKQARAKDAAHLPQLQSYWSAQSDTVLGDTLLELEGSVPFGLGLASIQAHRCDRCVWFRPELLEQALPPCHFTTEPTRQQWDQQPIPPKMAVLVREDGLMVPRCEMFRRSEVPAILPVAGVRFGQSHVDVLAWLHQISKMVYSNDQHGSLIGPLAWLPYRRAGRHDVQEMVSWVGGHWEELGGDEALATLLSVALSETRALDGRQKFFRLMDADTRETNAWAAAPWSYLLENKPAPGWGWPEGWPQPWLAK